MTHALIKISLQSNPGRALFLNYVPISFTVISPNKQSGVPSPVTVDNISMQGNQTIHYGTVREVTLRGVWPCKFYRVIIQMNRRTIHCAPPSRMHLENPIAWWDTWRIMLSWHSQTSEQRPPTRKHKRGLWWRAGLHIRYMLLCSLWRVYCQYNSTYN